MSNSRPGNSPLSNRVLIAGTFLDREEYQQARRRRNRIPTTCHPPPTTCAGEACALPYRQTSRGTWLAIAGETVQAVSRSYAEYPLGIHFQDEIDIQIGNVQRALVVHGHASRRADW